MTKNLTRLVAFVTCTGALSACGGQGTPTQPTAAATKETQSTVATTPPATTPAPPPTPGVTPPTPSAPPPWVLSGPSDCVTAPLTKVQWTLTVNDAGAGTHLVTNVFKDRLAGCGDTLAVPFSGLAVAGPRDYAAGAKGETVLTFDPAQLTCGRAQVDVALNGTLIIGTVVNSGRDCPASVPPPPTPPPPAVSAPSSPGTCALTVTRLNFWEDEATETYYATFNARVSWTSSATLGTIIWGDGRSQPVNQGGYNHTFSIPEAMSERGRYTIRLDVSLNNGQCDARQTITVAP